MPFNTLGLSQALLDAIDKQGYTQPTPIQAKAIPPVLDGRDVLAAAQTGTGKTAAFTLPLLHRLSASPKQSNAIRALIVTPTRELAAQVHESVQTYGASLPFSAQVVFGGVKLNPQIKRLQAGCTLLIATPGRLLDLVQQNVVDLKNVEVLVLDEADRMLDMGFIHDVKRIIKLLPPVRQNLLFSATFAPEIKALAKGLMRDPVMVEVARDNAAAASVEQNVFLVDKTRKRALLSYMIGSQNWKQVLVFARTKHGANRLAKQLETDGLRAAAIHGNKSQGARTRALADFKAGKVRVLVATDIAARGLDIDQLPHVVNYDLPQVPEDYVHRIGRTGRASCQGVAVSLVSADEHKMLRAIERLTRHKIKREVFPGYEPTEMPVKDSQPARKKPRHAAGGRGRRHNNKPPRRDDR